MDNQKDKNITSNDAENKTKSLESRDLISFVSTNDRFIFAYKKTEKLATALYLVTNLFDDTEPMKWTLRKKVSDLLSFTVGYVDILVPHQADFARSIATRVLEITSLLEVSFHSGLISQMNFSILKDEFSYLTRILTEVAQGTEEAVSRPNLSHGFFDTNMLSPHAPVMSETHLVNKNNPVVKDIFKKTNRQSIILHLLQKKKELSIKDIAQTIKDCSEKTIQRELISLISAGVLKKTGERRWSRYSLNTM